jgi:hypothetical protein
VIGSNLGDSGYPALKKFGAFPQSFQANAGIESLPPKTPFFPVTVHQSNHSTLWAASLNKQQKILRQKARSSETSAMIYQSTLCHCLDNLKISQKTIPSLHKANQYGGRKSA